ncbi:hypothetical protein VTL71DRAFT_10614 [Oculimacula yallundae]|uniref:Uncharacterized protein n=1 Tax=Oculimacula yallundae TaxID=86028 RepID=A0ABR4CTM3_9HELO
MFDSNLLQDFNGIQFTLEICPTFVIYERIALVLLVSQTKVSIQSHLLFLQLKMVWSCDDHYVHYLLKSTLSKILSRKPQLSILSMESE